MYIIPSPWEISKICTLIPTPAPPPWRAPIDRDITGFLAFPTFFANLNITWGCEQLGWGEGDLTQVPGGSFKEKIKILHPGAGKEWGEWVALVILDLTFPHPGPLYFFPSLPHERRRALCSSISMYKWSILFPKLQLLLTANIFLWFFLWHGLSILAFLILQARQGIIFRIFIESPRRGIL